MGKFLLSIGFIIATIFNLSMAEKADNNKLSIIIDLEQRTLSVLQDEKTMKQYPISIGTELSPTPIGLYMVTEKSKSWGGWIRHSLARTKCALGNIRNTWD